MDTIAPEFEPHILPNDGAVLDIGPDGIRMIVQLAGIEDSEVLAIRKGTLEIGVLSSRISGILLTRFQTPGDGKGPIVLDMPFHIGLLPKQLRYLRPLLHGQVYGLLIQIQDETGRQHGSRIVSLSEDVCLSISELVARQARLSNMPPWSRVTHDCEIEDFYALYPDVAGSADKLFASAHARQTVFRGRTS